MAQEMVVTPLDIATGAVPLDKNQDVQGMDELLRIAMGLSPTEGDSEPPTPSQDNARRFASRPPVLHEPLAQGPANIVDGSAA